ncbi:hypothetical protein PM082_019574 [Marasmius tenuissimus]|nr:hypothetical protein PM082_019574 [Marasmius tenuissimus]
MALRNGFAGGLIAFVHSLSSRKVGPDLNNGDSERAPACPSLSTTETFKLPISSRIVCFAHQPGILHMESYDHNPYIASSQLQVHRTSFVVRSMATPTSDPSTVYTGYNHPAIIHRQEVTYSINVYRTLALPSESTPTGSVSPRSTPPLPDLHPASQSVKTRSHHTEQRVVYTEDASTRLSSRVRRRCFTCGETETSAWRRSNHNPGKLLCNKCGLAERKSSSAFPQILELEQRQAKFMNASSSNRAPPPMSTVPHAHSGLFPMQRRCRSTNSHLPPQKRRALIRRTPVSTPPITIG